MGEGAEKLTVLGRPANLGNSMDKGLLCLQQVRGGMGIFFTLRILHSHLLFPYSSLSFVFLHYLFYSCCHSSQHHIPVIFSLVQEITADGC